jgi:ATP-dependent Clp protease ATP-binding subunit ClpA
MMSPLFSPAIRETVARAQRQARRLGHNVIGSEHLLLALAGSRTPAGAALREQGVTPDQVRAQILLLPGASHASRDTRGAAIDAEALATIGIDLDAVRARVERAFGPGALTRPVRCTRRPAWRRIRLTRRPGRRSSRRHHLSLPGSHLPLTSRARQMLECAQREARAQQATTAGADHLALAVIATNGGGLAPAILSALGVAEAPLRHAILERYRPAS